MRFTISLAVLGSVLTLSLPVAADDHPLVVKQWEKEDAVCRGSAGGEKKIFAACDRREKVAEQVTQAGWCLGKAGQATYQYKWHKCAKGSINVSGNEYEYKKKPVANNTNNSDGVSREALLKGTWGEVGKTCKDAKDEEASFFYNGAKFVALEQDCIVLNSSEKTDTVTLNMLCVEEMGHKSKIKQNIKFIDNATVFTNSTKYKKCS